MNFERGAIHLRQTKSGKDRLVPINSTVRAMLESLPKSSSFVFPSPRTGARLIDIKVRLAHACLKAWLTFFEGFATLLNSPIAPPAVKDSFRTDFQSCHRMNLPVCRPHQWPLNVLRVRR
jgi:hypothetical protein